MATVPVVPGLPEDPLGGTFLGELIEASSRSKPADFARGNKEVEGEWRVLLERAFAKGAERWPRRFEQKGRVARLFTAGFDPDQ